MDKQLIIKSLYNLYNLGIQDEVAQKNLSSIYEAQEVAQSEQLSIKEIKTMKFGQFLQTKANEAMSVSQAGFGGDRVNGEILVNTIINRVRDKETLLSFIPNQRTMVNPIEAIPVEGADFEMTSFPSGADVPGVGATKTKAGTKKLTLTAKTLGATVYFELELLEDSVQNIMQYVERKLLQAFVTTVHKGIISGDVGDTINGTTATNSVLRKMDGLRKKAIAAGNVIQAGVIDLQDVRAARALLGAKGVDPNDLVFIVDHSSYQKLLGLTPVETMEKFGNAATVVNGTLSAIDGIKLLPRTEVPLTLATGIVSDTPALNVAGNLILAYAPSLYIGRRRALMIENDYDTTTQQYFFTGSTRFDFAANAEDGVPVAVITNTVA